MSAVYPLSVHRRIQRQWDARIKSLKRIQGKIVIGAEKRPLQRLFDADGLLTPLPAKGRGPTA